jgi:hypothetical protein
MTTDIRIGRFMKVIPGPSCLRYLLIKLFDMNLMERAVGIQAGRLGLFANTMTHPTAGVSGSSQAIIGFGLMDLTVYVQW